MASGQKKKTTGKARQGGGQSRQTSRSPQKNPRPPIRREVGGGVCLLLALCVVVSYFQADAIVLNLLGDLLKGLTGYGYWLAAPALALAGVNLLAHRGRPVALRTVCTLVTPVLLGAILHLFLYQGETVTGLGPLMKSLWADGLLLKSGGAVAGGLAAGMKRLVGTMVSVIVLLLLLAAALLAALRVSPRELVQRARDRVPYEPQPEPERPARPERPRRQRPSVDVPLDDAPVPREKTADRRSEPPEEPLPRKKGKGFFARKGDDVMTPDQVLRPQAPAPQTEAPTVQEPAAEPVQAPAQTPAQEPVPEKKSRRGQAAAQEVEQHAQEVGQAIEEELAEPEEAYQYPPVTLLDQNTDDNYTEVGAELRNNSRRLAQTITSFGVDAKPGDVVHGPSVTRYEFTLDQGVKLSKLTNLADDIALALGSGGVRIAPIPNKSSVVGIEVPNRVVTAVRIRDVIDSRAFAEHRSRVAFAVGKDISGAGMDPNVTGRSAQNGISRPFAERIVARDLTDEAHHNATGMGNADVTTRRLFDKIDMEQTYPNSLTSRDINGFRIPIVMENDNLAIRFALHTITGANAKSGYRAMWIRDTNHVQTFYVTERLLADTAAMPWLRTDGVALRPVFGLDGYFTGWERA